MSCNRYYYLLTKLQQAAAAERAHEVDAYTSQSYQEALARVRVHAEDCEICIDQAQACAKKEIHIQSLV